MDSVTESVCADNQVVDDNGIVGKTMVMLRDRIGPQKFDAWFRHGTQLTLEANALRIAVPNPFVANWIESHYLGEVRSILQQLTGQDKPATVTVDPALAGQLSVNDLDSQADLVAKSTEGRARRRRPIHRQPLKHKLDDFVVGESNRLAHTAACVVADAEKPPFNPLFVHGPCGVGKTHLLQGACARLKNRHSDRDVRFRYVTGEQFTNEFIQAVRNKTFQQFRDRYRKLDLLAIDDVHFLAAKRATQDEFLHTFNAIESAGKQIILASDTHPHLLSRLNEQLLSRFGAGMVVRIEPPDQQTRIHILQRKAAALAMNVDEDVLAYIASHIRGSVRELEGTLIKLAAIATLENGKATLDLARSALADHLSQTDSALGLADIEAVTAAYFGVTPADLHSSRRTRAVSLARMVTMHLARRHTTMSFPEIGRAMGKNHSSVVLAVQRMERLLAEKAELTWPSPAGQRRVKAADVAKLLAGELA